MSLNLDQDYRTELLFTTPSDHAKIVLQYSPLKKHTLE
jgi:hypothetical protein